MSTQSFPKKTLSFCTNSAAFLKKHKHPLLVAGVVLCTLIFLMLVWLTYIVPNETKSTSVKVNDIYDTQTEALTGTISQSFSTDDDIYAIALIINFEGEQPQGELYITLRNADTSEVLATATGALVNVISSQYTGLGLDTPIQGSIGAHYLLEITASYQNDTTISFACSSTPQLDSELLLVNDTSTTQTLALLLTTAQIGSFLSAFYWAVALGLLALLLTLYLLLFMRRSKAIKLHHAFAIACAVLGLFYCMVLPAYSSPDEQFHINQSFNTAARWASTISPSSDTLLQNFSTNYKRVSDTNAIVENATTTVFTWQEIQSSLFTTNNSAFGSYTTFSGYQVETHNLYYLFSSLGVFVGFVLHLGFVPTLLLGRCFNFIFYLLCATFAVKKTPIGKNIFIVVALLPMSLHVAMSFSRDSVILALSLLFCALCLDWALQNENAPLSKKQGLLLLVLGAVLAPAKRVYFPITLAFLIIPTVRFGKKAWQKKAALVCIFAFVFLWMGAGTLISNSISSLFTANDVQTEIVMQDSFSEALSIESTESYIDFSTRDNDCYSLASFFHSPVVMAKLITASIIEKGEHYLVGFVGGNLSYFSLEVSILWVLFAYILLFASLIPTAHEPILSPLARAWIFLMVLGGCALIVLGCITWTPLYYTTIYGLQGRYFLPLAVSALIALYPNANRFPLCFKKPFHAQMLFACAVLNMGVLLNAILVIVTTR